MKDATRTSWQARLQIALWRHGSAGGLLLVALLVSVGVLMAMLRQTDAALAAARQALMLHNRPAPDERPSTQANDATHISALRALLVASPAPDEVVRHMAVLSQDHGIAWAQGEYRAQWHATTQTLQWRVTQPLLTTYPQLRQLIVAVLRAHPNVSLDQVAVQRTDAAQAQLQVRLRWSIWVPGVASPAHPRTGR